jgi:hypothetical protein
VLSPVNRKNTTLRDKRLEDALNKKYFGREHGNLNYRMRTTKVLEWMVEKLKVVMKYLSADFSHNFIYLQDSTTTR